MVQIQKKQIADLHETVSRLRSDNAAMLEAVTAIKTEFRSYKYAARADQDRPDVQMPKTPRVQVVGTRSEGLNGAKVQSGVSLPPDPVRKIQRQPSVVEQHYVPALGGQRADLRPMHGQGQPGSHETKVLPSLRALDAASGITSWHPRASISHAQRESPEATDAIEPGYLYRHDRRVSSIDSASYHRSEEARSRKRQKLDTATMSQNRVRIDETQPLNGHTKANFAHGRVSTDTFGGHAPRQLRSPHLSESNPVTEYMYGRQRKPSMGTMPDVYRESTSGKSGWERTSTQHRDHDSYGHHNSGSSEARRSSNMYPGSTYRDEGLGASNGNTKRSRTKPFRNDEGILIRKDGRPDMRSVSSAMNLRKVHAKKEARRQERLAGGGLNSATPVDESHEGFESEDDQHQGEDESVAEKHECSRFDPVELDSAETAPDDRSPVTPEKDRQEETIRVRITDSTEPEPHSRRLLKRSLSGSIGLEQADDAAGKRSQGEEGKARSRVDSAGRGEESAPA